MSDNATLFLQGDDAIRFDRELSTANDWICDEFEDAFA